MSNNKSNLHSDGLCRLSESAWMATVQQSSWFGVYTGTSFIVTATSMWHLQVKTSDCGKLQSQPNISHHQPFRCRIGQMVRWEDLAMPRLGSWKLRKGRIVVEGQSGCSTAAWSYYAKPNSYTRPCRPCSVSRNLSSSKYHWWNMASSRQHGGGHSERLLSLCHSTGSRRLDGVKNSY